MKKIHHTTARAAAALGILMLWALLIPAAASAADGSKLTATLGDIKWGDSKVEVLNKIRDQRLNRLRKDKRLVKDRPRMQRARKVVLDWYDGVEKSFVRFDGRTKGYDVSIVASHYTDRNGESMLVAKDRVAQRFFFFASGKLYKLVVAYNAGYIKDVGFDAFAAQAARKYGRPISTEYGEIEGNEELVKVTWTDGKTEMDVENMKEFYGTYSMVFKDRVKVKQMLAQNDKAGGAGKSGGEDVSSEIAFLTQEGGSDRNKNAVDNLIGGVDVDLSVKELQEQEAKDAAAAGGDSKKGKKDKKGRKGKKAKKRKKRRTKKVSKRDFTNLKAKGGDDELIIY